MKATHIDYKRPGCLRVTGAPKHRLFTRGKGWHETDVICMSPDHPDYAKLNRKGLPVWKEPEPEPEEVSSEDSSKTAQS